MITDSRTHKVIVKGDKADPLKVLDRVQRKIHKHVELLSPIPKPPAEEKKPEEKEKPKPEEKKEEVFHVLKKVFIGLYTHFSLENFIWDYLFPFWVLFNFHLYIYNKVLTSEVDLCYDSGSSCHSGPKGLHAL